MKIENLQPPQPLSELLQDGRVFWVAGGEIEVPIVDSVRQLWICGAAVDYGQYPEDQAAGYRVDWKPVHDGWRKYLDTWTALGTIQIREDGSDHLVYGHLMADTVPEPTDTTGRKIEYFLQIIDNPSEQYLEPWLVEAA